MSDPGRNRRHAVLYQAASQLLEWPDEQLVKRLPLLRAVAAEQPAPAGAQMTPLLEKLSAAPLITLQADYVETFDLRRRCCLYLTYYAYGDTRKRGMALLTFKQTFKRAGVVLTQDELPDHLCVLLEFAATVDLEVGRQLLLDNRAGLELLRLALADRQSPYAGVLAAISSTLPTLRGDEREAVAKLVAQGPPAEEVGLEPFGPPPVGLRSTRMNNAGTIDVLLWVVLPYVCLAIFIVGHVWRYRYDKFGWTTRSSQLYESRLLRWGSPLFHFGILFVFGGHVMGLGIPQSWTEFFGISEHVYHVLAISVGAVAGFCTIVGMIILIYRRRTVGPVFSATTRMDKLMYAVLATVIVLGLANTVGQVLADYNYRQGVSIWFRGIFRLSLHPDLMAQAPLSFQLHGIAAFLLFALWPFTRLVHVFSAPLKYLWRPYIVYREKPQDTLGSRTTRRGWDKSELKR